MFLRKQSQEAWQFHLNNSSILLLIFIKTSFVNNVSFGQHFTTALRLNMLLEHRH